jgi:hypothetical protein
MICDFSKRRNENPFRFHSGVALHDMIERFYFYIIIFSQKEMGSKNHMADLVVHNMIDRIYFHSIIFSQKEMGSEKHMADMVVPVQFISMYPIPLSTKSYVCGN